MDNPVGAIRYAIRQFRLSPVFTASAVLTLSLGIGGTTAIFTLIHAVMLRSLPVAGLAPPGFFGDTLRNNPPDLWIPIQHEPMVTGANSLLRQPVSAWVRVIGRLKPGATTDGIAPRLTNVLRQWIPRDSGWPANWLSDIDHLLPKQTIAIVPAGAGVGVMKEQYASSLQLLMAVCGLVLLIACANVANLLLARSVARRTQTAVRMAIGASRSQLITAALRGSLLVAIGGGIAGLAVAMGAARLLLSLAFSVSTF